MKIPHLSERYFTRLTLAPRRGKTLEFIRPGIGICFPQPDNPVHLLQRKLQQAFDDDSQESS